MGRSLTFEKVAIRLSSNKNAQQLFELLAETFKTLGDYSRVQIVWVLSQGELCVGDVAELLSMSPSAVSHHLRTLRNLKLVKVRREHRTLFYSLDDKHIDHLLDEGIEHVEDLLQ
jgi:ArsR family transcriptional regulator, lead/cadmium/zinc/bismuth-responsive transcriptional repressor